MARQYIESKNVEYIERDLRIQDHDYENEPNPPLYHMTRKAYRVTVKAIEIEIDASLHIVRPPVNVEAFRNEVLFCQHHHLRDKT